VKSGLDNVRGHGAFAADAPVIAAEFDDGGRDEALGFTGVEDERKAVAELAENLVTAGTGGRTGNVGTCAGERNTEFLDESHSDFASGPTKSNAARVAGDFERKAHGGVQNDGERAGPESVGQAVEIVGEFAGENVGVMNGIDEDGKGFGFGATLDAENFVDGCEVDGIGGKSVEGVGGNGNNRTAIEPASCVTDEAGIRRIRAEF
jgi:hypothetical protein